MVGETERVCVQTRDKSEDVFVFLRAVFFRLEDYTKIKRGWGGAHKPTESVSLLPMVQQYETTTGWAAAGERRGANDVTFLIIEKNAQVGGWSSVGVVWNSVANVRAVKDGVNSVE